VQATGDEDRPADDQVGDAPREDLARLEPVPVDLMSASAGWEIWL
jgi:hypothetical protein